MFCLLFEVKKLRLRSLPCPVWPDQYRCLHFAVCYQHLVFLQPRLIGNVTNWALFIVNLILYCLCNGCNPRQWPNFNLNWWIHLFNMWFYYSSLFFYLKYICLSLFLTVTLVDYLLNWTLESGTYHLKNKQVKTNIPKREILRSNVTVDITLHTKDWVVIFTYIKYHSIWHL